MGCPSGCPLSYVWHRGKGMNMTTLKIADKEYKIKYGYEATVKSGIIKKLTAFSTEKAEKTVWNTLI